MFKWDIRWVKNNVYMKNNEFFKENVGENERLARGESIPLTKKMSRKKPE
jgi:hypothetical protein